MRDPKKHPVQLAEIEKISSNTKREKKIMLQQAILYGIEMLPEANVKKFSPTRNQKINRHDSEIIKEKGEIYENLYSHLS
jgi:hypothetical protein